MAMPEIVQPAWEARTSNTDEAEALRAAAQPRCLCGHYRAVHSLAAGGACQTSSMDCECESYILAAAPGPNQGRVPGHTDAVEAEALVLRERLRRTAEECDALISILTLNYMACTPDNVIDCLRAIVRVAKGEDRR